VFPEEGVWRAERARFLDQGSGRAMPGTEAGLARRDKPATRRRESPELNLNRSGSRHRVLQKAPQTAIIRFQETGMVNYILLFKIRRIVKRIIKDKIADDEIATTPKSCLGCLADDISWEVYYLLKEKEEKDRPTAAGG
jgi:hypothetical protein